MKKSTTLQVMSFPAMVLISLLCTQKSIAQEKKEIKRTIIIENGDTTINGKKLQDVSKSEQAKLRKEMKDFGKHYTFKNDMSGSIRIEKDSSGNGKTVTIKRFDNGKYVPGDKGNFNFRIEKGRPGAPRPFVFKKGDSSVIAMNIDSGMRNFEFKLHGLDSNLRSRMFGRLPVAPEFDRHHFEFENGFGMRDRENTQSFNFRNTDKDGITTKINLRISDAGEDVTKKISGQEKSQLNILDLNLFPNFSTGKMTLSFNLDTKGTAKVQVLDRDLKAVFTDNSSTASFNKQIDLPKNGVYYLAVSSNGAWSVKKIIKE